MTPRLCLRELQALVEDAHRRLLENQPLRVQRLQHGLHGARHLVVLGEHGVRLRGIVMGEPA